MLWVDGVLFFGAFLVSLSVYECAHAWTGWKQGDSTGVAEGRVSLNPLRHIDPFGTVLLPLVLMFGPWSSGKRLGIPFGYSKHMPYNPCVFKDPATGMALVAAAGPLSNVFLAVGVAAPLGVLHRSGAGDGTVGLRLLEMLVPLNVRLAVFNLIPIALLDPLSVLAGRSFLG